MSKTILAFDTTMSVCSISLFYKNKIYNINKNCNQDHTKYILPMIKKICTINNININKINIIATSKGPGSFSGTRISLSVAQGLSLGLNCPIIMFSTSLIMAEEAWKTYNFKKIIILNILNKTYMYLAKYIRHIKGYWIKQLEEKVSNINNVIKKINLLHKEKWILIGNGWNLFPKNITKIFFVTNITFPNSKYIISLILSNKIYKKTTLSYTVHPIYI